MKKIYRFLIKFLCIFVPTKSLRDKIRNNTYKKQKDISIKKLKKMYPNSIFFWLPIGGVGEFTEIICSMKPFKEKINKNIVLLTNKKLERDVISLIDENIVKCYYEDVLYFDVSKVRDETLYLEDNLSSDKIYPAYKYANENFIKRDSITGFLKDYYHLDQDVEINRITPVRPKNKDKNFLELEKIFKNKKTIFIFPEANTYDYTIITKEVWIDIAKKLTNDGYTCIFNSKEKYGDFINVFLDIKETLYLASLANSIITFRSGIAELLAISTTCNMIVAYPNGKEYFFIKESLRLFGTSDNYRKFLSSEKCPYILNKNQDLIKSFFEFDSVQKHFNKKNCQNYIYDFDDDDFYKFIINNI